MPLEKYRQKRDPKRTPEPFGGKAGGDALRFVVQRHAARSLHYDFRLERDGVLLSWAVPKGVPMALGERHLAVHVEDHPLDYGDFEGEIPAGQYGAGTVEIWDRGTYELVEEKKDGGLTVRLHGEPARRAVDARAGPSRRQGEELAPAPQGRGRQERASTRRCSPPRPTSCRSERGGRSSRSGTGSGRWRASTVVSPPSAAATTTTSRRASPRRPAPLGLAVRSPSAVLDGEICALDETGPLGVRPAPAGSRRRSSSSPSTCSRWTASRSSTGPTPSGARRSSSSSTRRSRASSSRRRSTTGPRSSGPRASTGSRASSRS